MQLSPNIRNSQFTVKARLAVATGGKMQLRQLEVMSTCRLTAPSLPGSVLISGLRFLTNHAIAPQQ
jgi:hypothetical protein